MASSFKGTPIARPALAWSATTCAIRRSRSTRDHSRPVTLALRSPVASVKAAMQVYRQLIEESGGLMARYPANPASRLGCLRDSRDGFAPALFVGVAQNGREDRHVSVGGRWRDVPLEHLGADPAQIVGRDGADGEPIERGPQDPQAVPVILGAAFVTADRLDPLDRGCAQAHVCGFADPDFAPKLGFKC